MLARGDVQAPLYSSWTVDPGSVTSFLWDVMRKQFWIIFSKYGQSLKKKIKHLLIPVLFTHIFLKLHGNSS